MSGQMLYLAPGRSEPFTSTFPPPVFTSPPQLQCKAGNMGNAPTRQQGPHSGLRALGAVTCMSFTVTGLGQLCQHLWTERKVERGKS